MRFGIIDLGTNSVRFDVHELDPSGIPRPLFREKLMVRLGQDVFLNGKLNRDAVLRTEEAFLSFRSISDEIGVDRVVAYGTSALREAKDGSELIDLIYKKAGITIQILSGHDEARLIALGVLTHEGDLLKEKLGARFALVDIGGGSTEITICDRGKIIHSESFPLGTARLQQVFLRSSPPSRPAKGELSSIDQLRRAAKSILLPKILSEEWPKTETILGSSGTIKALQKLIHKKSKKRFSRSDLSKLNKKMSKMTANQLRALPRMETKRVDMILAGSILLEECAEALSARFIETTDFSLRDGILEQELSHNRKLRKKAKLAPNWQNALARRLQKTLLTPAEIRARLDCAKSIFGAFRGVCKFTVEDEVTLTAAFLFLSLARKLSITETGPLAADLLTHFDLPEIALSTRLKAAKECVNLGFTPKQLTRESQVKNSDGLKVQSVLRLLSALIENPLKLKKSAVKRTEIDLQFETQKGDSSLAFLRVEQKKDLFEEISGKNLVILS